MALLTYNPSPYAGPLTLIKSSATSRDHDDATLGWSFVAAGVLGPQRFGAWLGTIFAAIGFVLAVVGVYSVTSYSVTQRTREFCIRLSLGAQRKDLVSIVFRDGLRLVGLGLGIGVLCGLGLSRVIASVLYQVSPAAPQMLVAIALTLALVSMVAMYMPTRRIMKVDLSSILRHE